MKIYYTNINVMEERMANIDVVNNINSKDKKYTQQVSMTNDSNTPLLQVYTPGQSKPLAVLTGKNKLVLKFNKTALKNLVFEDRQEDIITNLLNGNLEIVNNAAVMMNVAAKSDEVSFKINAGSSEKIIDVTISPLGITVDYDNKTYKAIIKETTKDNDGRMQSNNFVLSTEMFKKLVGNEDRRFASHTISKVPAFMWYQYFSTANLQDFVAAKLSPSLKAVKFSTNDTAVYSIIEDNRIKLFHDGSFKEIKSLHLFKDSSSHFLIMEYGRGKGLVSVRIKLPTDEKERSNIISNFENTFSVNFEKYNNGKYKYEQKDSTGYAEYSFRLPNKRTITIADENKKQTGGSDIDYEQFRAMFANLSQELIAAMQAEFKALRGDTRSINQTLQLLLGTTLSLHDALRLVSTAVGRQSDLLIEIKTLMQELNISEVNLNSIYSKIDELINALSAIAEDLTGKQHDYQAVLARLKANGEKLDAIIAEIQKLPSTNTQVFEQINQILEKLQAIETQLGFMATSLKNVDGELELNLDIIDTLAKSLTQMQEKQQELLKLLQQYSHNPPQSSQEITNLLQNILNQVGLLKNFDATQITDHLSTISNSLADNPTKDQLEKAIALLNQLAANKNKDEVASAMKELLTSLLDDMTAAREQFAYQLAEMTATEDTNDISLNHDRTKEGQTLIVNMIASLEKETPQNIEQVIELLQQIQNSVKDGKNSPVLASLIDRFDAMNNKLKALPAETKTETALALLKNLAKSQSAVKGTKSNAKDSKSKTSEQPKTKDAEKTAEKETESDDKIELPGTEKKLDTSFWAETGTVLISGIAMIAAALTGIGAFVVVAIGAMAASFVLTSINGSKIVLPKRTIDAQLTSNKYTLFRNADLEYAKSLENYKTVASQAHAWLESDEASAEFGKSFMEEFAKYGREPQTIDYVSRFAEIVGSEPSQTDLEALAKIHRANTKQDRQKAIDEFIKSQPKNQQEKLKKTFAKTSFFDQDHYYDQAQVAEGLLRLQQTKPGSKLRESEIVSFIEETFPNLDKVTQEEFFEDCSKYSSSDIIDRYFGDLPTVAELEKQGKTKNEIAATLTKDQVEKDLKVVIKNSKDDKTYATEFLKQYHGAIHDHQVTLVAQRLLTDENIKASSAFIQHCQVVSGAALSSQQKRDGAASIISKSNHSFSEFLFYHEKNIARQKQLIDRYSDIFMLNNARSQDSQMWTDRLTASMDASLQNYAVARFQYESCKLDRTIAKLHQHIFDSKNIENEINTEKSMKEALDSLRQLNSKEGATCEALTDALYQKLIEKSVAVSKGKDENFSVSADAQKAFLDLHEEIKASGILNNIMASFVSNKDDNNIYLSGNTADRYVKNQNSRPAMSSQSSQKTILELVDEHIKEALINAYIELQAQEAYSEDFDERIAQQQRLRQELSGKSIAEIEKNILKSDLNKLYKSNPTLKKCKEYLEKKNAFETKYGTDLYHKLYNSVSNDLTPQTNSSDKSFSSLLNENQSAVKIINLLPANMRIILLDRISKKKNVTLNQALKQELPKLLDEIWATKTTSLRGKITSPTYLPEYVMARARRSANRTFTIYSSDLDEQQVREEVQSLQAIRLTEESSAEESKIEETDRELAKQHKKLVELEVSFNRTIQYVLQNHGAGRDVNYTKVMIEFAEIIQNNAKALPKKYAEILQNALSGDESDKTVNEIVSSLKSISQKNGEKASGKINTTDKKLNIRMKKMWEGFVEQIRQSIKVAQEKNLSNSKKNKAEIKDKKKKQKGNSVRRKLRFYYRHKQKAVENQTRNHEENLQIPEAQTNQPEQSADEQHVS